MKRKPILVRIVNCSGDYWYKNEIGNIFDVSDCSEDTYSINGLALGVGYCGKGIMKIDTIIYEGADVNGL